MSEPMKKYTATRLTVAQLVEVLGKFDQSLPVLVQSWEGNDLDVLTEVEQIDVVKAVEGTRADYRWAYRPKEGMIPALIIR